MSRIRILLVSRSNAVAAEIDELLGENPGFKLTTKIVSNGHADPLQDVKSSPDILLLHCATGSGELQYLADGGSENRMPLVVVGPANNPDAMRLAMRAGASDYLTSPIQRSELLAALDGVVARIQSDREKTGQLVSVINSRGGSGASFLAANLAYGLHSVDQLKSILIDFDLQFGGLARFFDLNPKRGIIEAVEAADEMDEVSAETYITKHKSGLRLLAACTDSLSISNVVPVDKIDTLLRMFLRHNEFIVADLPRRIDLLGATVLESSDHILLVVQQSLSHLHDALMMTRLVTQELGVPANRITVVLNRHNKKSLIDTDAIRETLKTEKVVEIPNNYSLVSECAETGKPLLQSAKNSAVARAIIELQCHIRGVEPQPGAQSIFERALPAMLRRAQ